MSRPRFRGAAIALIAVLTSAVALALDPVSQPLSYHRFADRRAWLGIPNALDVASNLPFLVIGAMGLHWCLRHPQPRARYAWPLFFAGVGLVALGSAYYHWAPDNPRLVWDRLPMTVAFMALFVALLSEAIDPRLERYLLVPALVAGIGSVVYWRCSDDLRWYGLVQFGPLLLLPVVFLLYGYPFSQRRFLFYAFLCYATAKLCEALDRPVFVVTGGWLSGHTLKHLLAAAAVWCVYWMLVTRRPLAGRPASGA